MDVSPLPLSHNWWQSDRIHLAGREAEEKGGERRRAEQEGGVYGRRTRRVIPTQRTNQMQVFRSVERASAYPE